MNMENIRNSQMDTAMEEEILEEDDDHSETITEHGDRI